ncbi:MAG: carboxypeptidase regulatory-like domain-containing protein [Elusimicrobia bacterium]|nr:carboxypeptidase regulatory-like domain-containing protein [Elusimicrobiota bacterium]
MKTIRKKSERISSLRAAGILFLFFAILPPQICVAEDGLIGYWNFDEGSGNTAIDSSGSGNDGIINGAVYVDGVYGKALSFDGIDDYVNIGTMGSLGSYVNSGVTVEAWVNTTSDRENLNILGVAEIGTYNTNAFFVRLNHYKPYIAGNVIIWSQAGDPALQDKLGGYTDDLDVNDGNWHHVVCYMKRTDKTVKIYVDGQLRDNTLYKDSSNFNINDFTHFVMIGAVHRLYEEEDIAKDCFSGQIDELKIYNYELSEEEIIQAAQFPVESGFQGFAYERLPDNSIGETLPGVEITFTSEDGSFTRSLLTDETGKYKIRLDAARYTVTAECEGYEPYSTEPGFFVCTGDGYQTGNIFLHMTETPGETNMLLAQWDFDEGAGNTAIDSSGNGNDGTIIGGATYVEGVSGSALSFNGIDAYMDVGTLPGFGSSFNSNTLEMWLRWSSSDEWQSVFGTQNPDLRMGYFLYINKRGDTMETSPGDITFFIRENTDVCSKISGGTAGKTFNDGMWHHIAVRVADASQNEVELYVDGVMQDLIFKKTESPSIFTDFTVPVMIGSRYSDEYGPEYSYEGEIDKVRVYNYALSPEEIAIHAVDINDDVDDPPIVSLSVKPASAVQGDTVKVTVTGADDNDLAAIWWWGIETGYSELDKAHWYACSGITASNTWTIDTAAIAPGTYLLGANSRDSAYPVPDEPHQASEGEGIKYAQFTVMSREADLEAKDITALPDTLDAGTDRDVDMTVSFVSSGNSSVSNSFYNTVKINGILLEKTPVTYNPIPKGAGWRINFGQLTASHDFTSRFYRACVPGENEIKVTIDSDNDVTELDEDNNVLTKKIIVSDSEAPCVKIITPSENEKVKELIDVAADASDNIAVKKVEFYLNGSKKDVDSAYPYKWEWETHGVINGVYTLAALAYDTFGNTARAEVTVQVANDVPRAFIKVPKHRMRVRGNAVTIMADATDNTTEVRFQYRLASEEGDWTDITGTDRKKPYSCYWNVSRLKNDEYRIRAAAYDKYGCMDQDPEEITLFVDDVNWDIHENGNPDADSNTEHRKCEKFSKEEGATIKIADGTGVIIPPEINVTDPKIEIAVLNPDRMCDREPPSESSVKPVGVYREYKFTDGTKLFNKDITLVLPYPDEDEDGIVDGTDISASCLVPHWFDEKRGIWIPITGSQMNISITEKKPAGSNVKVKVNHFTLFALLASVPNKDLKDVIVYPNPYKPNSDLYHTNISFDGLTESAVVNIYTLAGRHVAEITDHIVPGKIQWNVTNSDGTDVASDVYFYVVTDKDKSPARGKIAVIR